MDGISSDNNKKNLFEESNDIFATYIESTNQIFSSFFFLSSNLHKFLEIVNARFELFDIVIKDVIQSNKKRKKKFYELYQEETCQLLEKSLKLSNVLEKIPVFSLENLKNLSNEFIGTLKTLQKDRHKNNNNNSLIKSERKLLKPQSNNTIDEETDLVSSRGDIISSNRLLISTKTKAFDSVLNREDFNFARQKKKYFDESRLNSNKINSQSIDSQNFSFEKDFPIAQQNQTKENLKPKTKSIYTPKQEKKMVLELMKKEYPNRLSSEKNSVFCHDGYFIFVKKIHFYILIANYGRENQAKFLIDANWWRNWTHYVGLGSQIDETKRNSALYPGKIINMLKYFLFFNYKRFFFIFSKEIWSEKNF